MFLFSLFICLFVCFFFFELVVSFPWCSHNIPFLLINETFSILCSSSSASWSFLEAGAILYNLSPVHLPQCQVLKSFSKGSSETNKSIITKFPPFSFIIIKTLHLKIFRASSSKVHIYQEDVCPFHYVIFPSKLSKNDIFDYRNLHVWSCNSNTDRTFYRVNVQMDSNSTS